MQIPTASLSHHHPSESVPPELNSPESTNSEQEDKSIKKPNQLGKQNSDCITRDAQNVFDKKKMRFEKIQKMRENS